MKKKCNRLLHYVLLIFMILVSVSFVPTSTGHAQTSDWTEPINLSNSGASKDPTMVVDTNGVIHVIWVDEFDGYKYVESADGITWTLPQTIDFPFLPENAPPRFEITSNGVIHILWLDDKNRLFYAQTLQTSFDTPASWRLQVRLGENVVGYDIAFDSTNTVHVTYITNETTENEMAGVYYRGSTNGGSSWSSANILFASQYFRSLTTADAHVQIATLESADMKSLIVVWDNPALKRIYMSNSKDGGQNWGDPREIIGPNENTEFENPFDVEINLNKNGFLLTWLAGESGIRCSLYSRWSDDGGDTWGQPVRVFDELPVCPRRVGFGTVGDEYSIMLLYIQESLAIVAWDGNRWSDLQVQNELSALEDPANLDPILLGCQYPFIHGDKLLIVGCDEGTNKDIWIVSRMLGSLEEWFPPPSAWSSPSVVMRTPFNIPSVSSTVSAGNVIHTVWAVWAPSSGSGDIPEYTIYYASWNKIEWSRPIPIMAKLSGAPKQLFLGSNLQDRLLLTWVDETNPNLMFSWVNSERAGIPQEWSSPIIVPTPEKLVSSPTILVDGAGTIIITYSVPFNENRGIYLVESIDLGNTWSMPIRVFDAVSAGWDSVNQPKIAATSDGILHILFSKYSLLENRQPESVYYMQSEDGGLTWSGAIEIMEEQINQSEIITHENQIYIFGQSDDHTREKSLYSKFSTDSGKSWNQSISRLSTTDKLVGNSSILDGGGQVHLLQLVSGETLEVREWTGKDTRWKNLEVVRLIGELNITDLIGFHTGITSDNYLFGVASIRAVDPEDNPDNQLISFGRYIDSDSQAVPNSNITILPTPVPEIVSTEIPSTQIIPTAVLILENETPASNKNTVGFIIIIFSIVLMLLVIKPSVLKKRN